MSLAFLPQGDRNLADVADVAECRQYTVQEECEQVALLFLACNNPQTKSHGHQPQLPRLHEVTAVFSLSHPPGEFNAQPMLPPGQPYP